VRWFGSRSGVLALINGLVIEEEGQVLAIYLASDGPGELASL
jgi:hypothetical protein